MPALCYSRIFLKNRVALAGGPVSSERRTFEAEGSTAWLARVVIAKIAGTPAPTPLDLPEGRGGRLIPLPEAYLLLARYAEQDASNWQFVRANGPECVAWCEFLKIKPRPIVVATTTKAFNGREYANWPVKEYGLRVALSLPPQQKPFRTQRASQLPQVSSTQHEIDRTETEKH
jgi:hypothetical protein